MQNRNNNFSEPVFHPNRGRTAIFIDGSHIFYAALQLDIELDYTNLLSTLTQHTQLLRAFFYTGVDNNNEKQQGFLLWMRRNGYRVVPKELIPMPDGSKKINLEVEMAVDMLTLAQHYDTAIVISGNGNLAYAVDAVSRQGARVEVVGLRAMTSDSLINVADTYLDLASIQTDIQKTVPGKGVSKPGQERYVYRPLTTISQS
ncbi:MAG: NYN domain-containing protein [Cyanobacteria bacterium P01_H01_bin.21]